MWGKQEICFEATINFFLLSGNNLSDKAQFKFNNKHYILICSFFFVCNPCPKLRLPEKRVPREGYKVTNVFISETPVGRGIKNKGNLQL
jgi:hypothetical protein